MARLQKSGRPTYNNFREALCSPQESKIGRKANARARNLSVKEVIRSATQNCWLFFSATAPATGQLSMLQSQYSPSTDRWSASHRVRSGSSEGIAGWGRSRL